MQTSSGQIVKVHLSIGFWIVGILLALISFGVWGIYFIWLARSWPSVLDDEGLTLRKGKRYWWKDLSGVSAVTVRHTTGIRLTGRVEMRFYNGNKIDKVNIVPFSTGNSEEALAFLSTRLGSRIRV